MFYSWVNWTDYNKTKCYIWLTWACIANLIIHALFGFKVSANLDFWSTQKTHLVEQHLKNILAKFTVQWFSNFHVEPYVKVVVPSCISNPHKKREFLLGNMQCYSSIVYSNIQILKKLVFIFSYGSMLKCPVKVAILDF
jgi:hypothetical protein